MFIYKDTIGIFDVYAYGILFIFYLD